MVPICYDWSLNEILHFSFRACLSTRNITNETRGVNTKKNKHLSVLMVHLMYLSCLVLHESTQENKKGRVLLLGTAI